jgi:hypothetical protein
MFMGQVNRRAFLREMKRSEVENVLNLIEAFT